MQEEVGWSHGGDAGVQYEGTHCVCVLWDIKISIGYGKAGAGPNLTGVIGNLVPVLQIGDAEVLRLTWRCRSDAWGR